jgi:Transposase DDE domain
LKKSRKHTEGLGNFWNGCNSRSERGLAASSIAIICPETKKAFNLSISQVIPENDDTQMDFDIKHLERTTTDFPLGLKYLAVDSEYANEKYVNCACGKDLEIVSKLRKDANMKFLYSGKQSGKGRTKLYDKKVYLETDLERLTNEGKTEEGAEIYSGIVYHISLKRTIKIVYLRKVSSNGKLRTVLLFSTDLELSATDLINYYRSRFQIEFIFRDAKQFTGLNDFQVRDRQKIDFHLNASMLALNVLRYESLDKKVISIDNYKRSAFNLQFSDFLFSQLDINPDLAKSHPNFQSVLNFGAIFY